MLPSVLATANLTCSWHDVHTDGLANLLSVHSMSVMPAAGLMLCPSHRLFVSQDH